MTDAGIYGRTKIDNILSILMTVRAADTKI
jgi:hypothetical protein